MSFDFVCPAKDCGNRVSLALRPSSSPCCTLHVKRTYLMIPEEGSEDLRARHAIAQRCGWCRETMVEGCIDSDPCEFCSKGKPAVRGGGALTEIVFGTCKKCQKERPWVQLLATIKAEKEPQVAVTDWVTVESTSIDAVRFRRVAFANGKLPDKGALDVRFKSGSVYRHQEVPHKLYEDLLASPSVGKFYNRSIRTVYDAIPADFAEQVAAAIEPPPAKPKKTGATMVAKPVRKATKTATKKTAKKATKKVTKKK